MSITGRDYIIINGVSSDTVGLYIDTPPMPVYQARNFQDVSIPNRGTLTLQQNDRADIQVDITAYLFTDEDSADPRTIYEFISAAETLSTSKSEDFYYKVKRVLSILPAYQGHGKQAMTISFICDPYRYSTDNEAIEITTATATINNAGGVYSQPVWKLYGTGTLTLTVNEDDENILTIPDVEGYVIADAEKLLCYKGSTIMRCGGIIPFLATGDNYIQTNATKIELTKNERWL